MKRTRKLCAIMAMSLSFGLLTGCPDDDENNDNNSNNTNNTKMDMTQDMPKMDMTQDMPKEDMPKEDMKMDMPKEDMKMDMPPGETPTCANYCATVMANCTGDNAQYSSEAECLSYCNDASGWDAGNEGDTAGNTIGCRTYHGGDPAKSDAATHCPHAGPSGANVCGTWCDTYCDLVFNNCTGGDKIYDTEAECKTACAAFPTDGEIGAVEFNTVQCRIYHLGTPAATDAGTHCPHGAEDGGGVCVGDQNAFNFATDQPSAYTQVDRMGIPALNTALITSKDAYNADVPANDANYAGEIVTNLTGIHSALRDDVLGANLTPCSTSGVLGPDVSPCLSQRIFQGGPTVQQAAIPDVLNIDPAGSAGFPNGRRPQDPVMDVVLAILLLDMSAHTPTTLVGVPLNPTQNDLGTEGAFLTTFPYLHPPHQ